MDASEYQQATLRESFFCAGGIHDRCKGRWLSEEGFRRCECECHDEKETCHD